MTEGLWRIGELSRRVGVSPQVLRAWETRYQLLDPRRSTGGYRLYSERDEARIRRVLALQARGLSTAEAAGLAREETEPTATLPSGGPAVAGDALGVMRSRLLLALVESDEAEAQAALDSLFAAVDIDTALVAGILPVLATIGDRWAAGELSVAAEHYASGIIQARLMSLARGWDQGAGRQALLACAPGEQHALGLLAFGLMLRRRGWRVAYLGASTPVESLHQWVADNRPDVVVITAVMSVRFEEVQDDLRRLAQTVPLLLGGAGASPAMAAAVGALAAEVDPIVAAQRLTGQILA